MAQRTHVYILVSMITYMYTFTTWLLCMCMAVHLSALQFYSCERDACRHASAHMFVRQRIDCLVEGVTI